MEQKENTLSIKGYDALAESPIICSDSLQHGTYDVDGITFHLWFQGECKPDWKKLKKDFSAFSKSQINHFGGFLLMNIISFSRLLLTEVIME